MFVFEQIYFNLIDECLIIKYNHGGNFVSNDDRRIYFIYLLNDILRLIQFEKFILEIIDLSLNETILITKEFENNGNFYKEIDDFLMINDYIFHGEKSRRIFILKSIKT